MRAQQNFAQAETAQWVQQRGAVLQGEFEPAAERFNHDARTVMTQEVNQTHGRLVDRMTRELNIQERGHDWKLQQVETADQSAMEEQRQYFFTNAELHKLNPKIDLLRKLERQ